MKKNKQLSRRPRVQFAPMPAKTSVPRTPSYKIMMGAPAQLRGLTYDEVATHVQTGRERFAARNGDGANFDHITFNVAGCHVDLLFIRDPDPLQFCRVRRMIELFLRQCAASNYRLPKSLEIILTDCPQVRENGASRYDPRNGTGKIVVYKGRKMLHILTHEMCHCIYQACPSNAFTLQEGMQRIAPELYEAACCGEPFTILGNEISEKNYHPVQFVEELICETAAHIFVMSLLRESRRQRQPLK